MARLTTVRLRTSRHRLTILILIALNNLSSVRFDLLVDTVGTSPELIGTVQTSDPCIISYNGHELIIFFGEEGKPARERAKSVTLHIFFVTCYAAL